MLRPMPILLRRSNRIVKDILRLMHPCFRHILFLPLLFSLRAPEVREVIEYKRVRGGGNNRETGFISR